MVLCSLQYQGIGVLLASQQAPLCLQFPSSCPWTLKSGIPSLSSLWFLLPFSLELSLSSALPTLFKETLAKRAKKVLFQTTAIGVKITVLGKNSCGNTRQESVRLERACRTLSRAEAKGEGNQELDSGLL